MAVTFTAADRVGSIGGIGQLAQMLLGGGMVPANAYTNNGGCNCNGNCSENTPVNRFELSQEQTISRLQTDERIKT